MIEVGGERILIGGFHDHWARTSQDNPALLLAAMDYFHYDFMCLMDGRKGPYFAQLCRRYTPWMKLYPGKELCFGWGHVITVGRPDLRPMAAREEWADVLAELSAEVPLVALAHPPFPRTEDEILLSGELERMLDEGRLQATEFCASSGEREMLARRQQAGKRTPIISGWDVHNIIPRPDLRPALYDGQKPDGHLDSCGGLRTIVFAPENSLEALVAAVKAERTVVESIRTGELFGPPALVARLEKHGYRERMAELDRWRDAVHLDVQAPALVGEPLALRFSSPGKVTVARTLDQPRVMKTDAQGVLHLRAPAIMDRDVTHLPVIKAEPDGFRRVFAVELHHPVQVDVLPVIAGGRTFVEVRPRRPFRGRWEMTIDEDPKVRAQGDAESLRSSLPVRPERYAEPLHYRFQAESEGGVRRGQQGILTLATAPRFAGDWNAVAEIPIDQARNVGGYGANRPYPGPDVFSVRLKFAWDAAALRMRADVVDAVHHNPFTGHYIYQADCLQLGIDPVLRRDEGMIGAYQYGCALTEAGPEVFLWTGPRKDIYPGLPPVTANVPVEQSLLKVERGRRGLVYTLTLPWGRLAPAEPAVGHRMGVYFIAMNNDGEGLLDALHWPEPTSGMWHNARLWGVLTLTE
jgi:hypothetical protein